MQNEEQKLKDHLNKYFTSFHEYDISSVCIIGEQLVFEVNFYTKALPISQLSNEKYDVRTVISASSKGLHIFETKITTPTPDK